MSPPLGGAKPKILAVTHDASLTGAPRAFVLVLDALEDMDLTTVIKHSGPLAAEFVKRSNRVIVSPGGRLTTSFRKAGGPVKSAVQGDSSALLRVGRRALSGIEQMVARRVIEQVAPDLVYVNSTSAGEYVIEALRASAGVVLHSREMGERLRGFVSRYRLRADEGLVLAACSSAAAADLADVLAVARADVAVIHDAVDSEGVSTLAGTPPKPQFPTVISVGTMEERKGTSDFLDIAEVVLASVNARFVWIGGGPLFDVMRREIGARGLQDSVRLAGDLDNPYPAIKGAEVLVSTSMEETFGLAIAEGMALGTPVAAYKVGGVPEAMGGTGIAVAPGDKQGMVTAVISLIRSPELCARIADEQLAHVREALSPERLKQQVLRLVGRLIR